MTTSSLVRWLFGWVLFLAICLALPGCVLSVTRENYDKVQTGMTQAEVEKIFGRGRRVKDPDLTDRDERFVWESGNKRITVTLRDGKVMGKSLLLRNDPAVRKP